MVSIIFSHTNIQWEIRIISTYIHMYIHTYIHTYIYVRTYSTLWHTNLHYAELCDPPVSPWTDLTLSMNSSNSGASRPFSTLAVGLPAKQPWQAASSKTLVRRTRRFSLNRRRLFFTFFASFFLLSKASRIIGCSSSTRSLHMRAYIQ